MFNKKILASAISILTALSMMGAATFAYFSDTGTSSNNTFSTGTLDLKLSDEAVNGGTLETDQNSVTSSFGSGSLVPGSCTGNQTLTLKNTGTVPANHAEVHLANVVTDNGTAANPDIDKFLRINLLTYDTSDIISQIANSNSTSFIDLADWAASATALDNLALANLGTDHLLVMDVCLDSTAGDTLQGDSVVSTFTVDLNQDSSQ
ncbi:M73 family metallopeptidase [Patescibacteria group bacterium]|nr:M73 family metallopeptidase [Patescibacteria group bacterium]MBU4016067.1 M73 family metallopeptidase [Patescibacteria group bacterium]MBU4078598.1 M73 family metallopeptidase [Patescibacteria group bacterium]MBU4098101.1 M73 family metallopeptidase [Patescibacteria group bacterium]